MPTHRRHQQRKPKRSVSIDELVRSLQDDFVAGPPTVGIPHEVRGLLAKDAFEAHVRLYRLAAIRYTIARAQNRRPELRAVQNAFLCIIATVPLDAQRGSRKQQLQTADEELYVLFQMALRVGHSATVPGTAEVAQHAQEFAAWWSQKWFVGLGVHVQDEHDLRLHATIWVRLVRDVDARIRSVRIRQPAKPPPPPAADQPSGMMQKLLA